MQRRAAGSPLPPPNKAGKHPQNHSINPQKHKTKPIAEPVLPRRIGASAVLHGWYPRAHLGQGDLSLHGFGVRAVRAASKQHFLQEITARRRRGGQLGGTPIPGGHPNTGGVLWGCSVSGIWSCLNQSHSLFHHLRDWSITPLPDREIAAHLFLVGSSITSPRR